MYPDALITRFWSHVDKSGECWLWTQSVAKRGYGELRIGGQPRRYAHRLAWELTYGPIPPGMHVLHRCDVRGCVNPAHLFLGTNADNMADRNAKGRSPRGERNGSAKLTAEDVTIIRQRIAGGEGNSIIARDYKVHKTTISDIRSRKHWGHL